MGGRLTWQQQSEALRVKVDVCLVETRWRLNFGREQGSEQQREGAGATVSVHFALCWTVKVQHSTEPRSSHDTRLV